MPNTVTIPSGTPLILEQRLFARELLDVLDELCLEGTKISDLVSVVVGKIMGNDVSFFQKFSEQREGDINPVIKIADSGYTIGIEGIGKNAEVVVTELVESSIHQPIGGGMTKESM